MKIKSHRVRIVSYFIFSFLILYTCNTSKRTEVVSFKNGIVQVSTKLRDNSFILSTKVERVGIKKRKDKSYRIRIDMIVT